MSTPSNNLTELRLRSGCKCFEKDGNTYKLLKNIKWRDVINIDHNTTYFKLKEYEVLDGQSFYIDMEDISYGGLFETSGIENEPESISKIINLGILNGILNKHQL
jgi:hypothetical protein